MPNLAKLLSPRMRTDGELTAWTGRETIALSAIRVTARNISRLFLGLGLLCGITAFGQTNFITVVTYHSVREGEALVYDAVAVRLNTVRTDNTDVQLAATPVGDLQIVTNITISAGQLEAPVGVAAIDNALLDGPRVVCISGTNVFMSVVPGCLTVLDNETAALSLIFPALLVEGQTTNAQLVASRAPDRDIAVQVALSPPGRFSATNSVVLAAGKTNATFSVRAIDNRNLDWSVAASLTANVENWTPAAAQFLLQDNESTNINLVLPASATEFAGTLTNAGRVTLGGLAQTNTFVRLDVTPPGRLILPPSVVVAAGTSNVLFDLTILDDTLPTGNSTNTVIASAWGLNNGQTTVRILEDDPAAFQFTLIPSPQFVGVAFTNRLLALAPNGQQLEAGVFPVDLWLESPAVTNVLPTATISNGQANLTITPSSAMMSGALVAQGRGARSSSETFNILQSLDRTINGPAKDVAWLGAKLYASVPDGAPAHAGKIVTVNLTTGELIPWATVPGGINNTGIFAGRLMASPEGGHLFVTAGLGGTIQVWNAQTGILSNSYMLPSGRMCMDLAIGAANPWRLVLAVAGTNWTSETGVVLDELLQPQSAPISHWLRSVIADPFIPETFYFFRPYQLGEWKTGTNGVASERTLRDGPYTDGFIPLTVADGLLFAANGYVTEVATTKSAGTLSIPSGLVTSPWNGRIVSDQARREVVVASAVGGSVTRLQSFGVTDLQLHREAFVPAPLSTPRRLLFCGSNTLALVASNTLNLVRWPPVPPGAGLADLAVLPQSLTSSPMIGSNWNWSVVLTNRGANPATDVRLRVYLATNITVIGTTILSGRVWTETNILHAWLPDLKPGSNAVISFTLRASAGGWTTNLFTVAANEDESNVADNQAGVVAYVAPSGAPESIESLRLAVRELAFDSLRQRLYALERTSATNQTALYILDGTTLQPQVLRMLNGTATHLRLSADGRFLYATERSGRSMLRVDLNDSGPDLQFETFNPSPQWQYRLFDFEVAPADSRSIVVVARTELPAVNYETVVACFRDGVKLSRSISLMEYTSTPASGMNLEFDAGTGDIVLARHTYSRDVECMRIVPDGLELANHYYHDGAAAGFIIVEGKLYTGFGDEIVAFSGRRLRSLPRLDSDYGLIGRDPNTDRLLRVESFYSKRVQVFDRLNLGRLGTIGLGNIAKVDSMAVLGDSRLALASEDGRVFLLKQSLLFGTPQADLAVQWNLQPPVPRVGQSLRVTIAVTNLGPSNAIAPAITFESPACFSRDLVSPAAASSVGSYFPYPLLWTNLSLAPGQGRIFEVQGKFTAAGTMLLAAGAADRAVDPSITNNRVTSTLPVAYDLARGQGGLLKFKVVDAARDPYRHGILAIVSGDDELAGQIAAVDLATGLVTGNWSVGTGPSKLAMSDDNRTLYVVTDGMTNVAKVDAQTMSVQSLIPASQGTNVGLRFSQVVVNPGASHQFAAVRTDTELGFYDPTNSVSSVSYDGGELAAFATDRFITYRKSYPYVLNRYRRLGSALLGDGSSAASMQIEGLRAAMGFVFAKDGRLVDPFSLTQVGAFSANGPAVTYAPANMVFFPGASWSFGLKAFDLQTQALLASEWFGSAGGQQPADLFHAEGDFFVERQENGDIMVMRTAATPVVAPADLAIVSLNAGRWRAGMICEWEVTVTNFGPDSAPSTRLDMRLPVGMKLAGADAAIISAVEPQVSLALGTLGAAQLRTVRVKAVAQQASLGDELVVSIRSEAVDPQLDNNVARLTKPIEFAQVPNRVDFVAFPADDMVYEPVRQVLYLACAQFTASVSNVVIAFDVNQGVIQQQVELPGRPGSLAVSSGGEFLYVSLDAAERIVRLTLPALETNLIFTTLRDDLPLPRPDCDIVVLPNQPQSIAFSRFGGGNPSPAGVWVFDNGQPRATNVLGGYGGIEEIELGLSSNTLVGYSSGQFRTLTINEDGIVKQPLTGGTIGTSDTGFAVGGSNILYGAEVFDRSTFSKRGVLGASFSPQASTLSASGDRVVFAAAQNYSVNPISFAAFRSDTLSLSGEARVPGVPGSFHKLVLWGEDGVAAFGGYLYLGRLDLAGPPSGDTDGDGMTDLWESQHGLNPVVNDASADLDEDGASNLLEYHSGTDPQSADDLPRIDTAVVGTNTLRLVFPCNGGRHFYVEKTSNLTNRSWTSVYDAVSPGGLQVYSTSGITSGQAYFRVRITP